MFTKLETVLDKGNKYLGMYTFLISGALPIIEYSALVVASELNEKINEPVKKYIGKLGILCLNSVENTIVITIIINKGFRTVHKRPKTDLRYRTFISRITSSCSKFWYLTNVPMCSKKRCFILLFSIYFYTLRKIIKIDQ